VAELDEREREREDGYARLSLTPLSGALDMVEEGPAGTLFDPKC
jgi:hypothetical protein